MSIVRQFHIFHSIQPGVMFTETEIQPREYASFVVAHNLEEAFKLSQNEFNKDWSTEHKPLRSTSVGDVIQDGDKFFMVCSTGFKELIEPEEDPATIADRQLNEDPGY